MKQNKKRNANGEGTVYYNGRYWVGQLTTGRDTVTGKLIRKSIYGKKKSEVMKKMTSLKYELDQGNYKKASNMLIKDWATYWLENFKKPFVAETTYDRYASLVENHIFRTIGNIKMNELTAFHIQEALNATLKRGLSKNTVAGIRSRLNDMLNKAVETGLLSNNPCTYTILPKTLQRSSPIALTKREQSLLLSQCLLEKNGQLFVFLIGTGMRISEALALTWDDVDFNNDEISVERSACEIRGHSKITDKTKTFAGKRSIPMSEKIKLLLMNIHYCQNHNMNTLNLVFPSAKNTIILSSNVRKRLKKFCDTAGIRRVSVHTLRHTFATRALEQNINMKVLSYIMGHKDIKVTINTYTHILTDFKKDNFSTVDIFS